MNLFRYIMFSLVALHGAVFAIEQPPANMIMPKPLSVRVVNFKNCVETSKIGKQEQASFDALKKQMEAILGEKEKTLNEMAAKLEDPDYLDSLSPEAETELKRKFRQLSQEYSQLQQQYFQVLQQTNVKVVQKLQDFVTKAAAEVAKQFNLSMILNDEVSFFVDPSLDISPQVVAVMDMQYDQELKEGKVQSSTPSLPQLPAAPTQLPAAPGGPSQLPAAPGGPR